MRNRSFFAPDCLSRFPKRKLLDVRLGVRFVEAR